MQHLDLEVIESGIRWSRAGETLWLCTVLATYGSSPRAPGSLLVACRDGRHAGSLSGGCVEEDFLSRLGAGDFQAPLQVIRYGESSDDQQRLKLPCGGTLGFEVVVCDPREEEIGAFPVAGVERRPVLPSRYLASEGCHASTAVVALTHDPRIDDLAMIEAVRTPAFYIGAMGSRQTSAARAERLLRSGGLSREEIARIHMPIGLDIGSKTPAEIALSVMADIVRVYHGKPR